MIFESYEWKKELYKNYLIVARFRFLKRRMEQSYIKFEKAIMTGAYIVRKLNEANKIPPSTLKNTVKLKSYIHKNTNINHLNWHHLEKHYDLEKIEFCDKDWEFLLNQIIHSYIFICEFDSKNQLQNIIINSDHTNKHRVFSIPLELIIFIFLTISEGDMTSVVYSKEDPKNLDSRLVIKNAEYTYEDGFDLENAVKQTMEGNIYTRS